MRTDPARKYRAFAPVHLPDRRWPDRVITKPPRWCNVDLRDGNQALVEPMDAERKLRMFEALLRMGFKEIEVGFPSSSQTDFDFVRRIIEEDRIPDDVVIQVLTQARPEQVHTTIESIRGASRAIVHLYNSTSPVQRRVVFRLPKEGIVDIAVSAAVLIQELCRDLPETDVQLEYSPESFSGTELDFSVEICEAVMDVWQQTPDAPIILNLPATVEMATPNVFADQIEWFGRHVRDRDAIVLSVHPHNDRGSAVAAAELAVMAGADRVEGTLFGNGERTGNVCLVTLALNLWSQGVDPGLEIGDIDALVDLAEHCNRLPVGPRHPYAGELVYTAFSGSHQDAIKKGFEAHSEGERWEVPYLPLDPADVGRTYSTVIRVNSQSGKGGIAYLLERDHGLHLPRGLQVEFRSIVQGMADASGAELDSKALYDAFRAEYFEARTPLDVRAYQRLGTTERGAEAFSFEVSVAGDVRKISGSGNGPIDALTDALRRDCEFVVSVRDYAEHALASGSEAQAIAYVEAVTPDGNVRFGAATHTSLVMASLRALASAANRARACSPGTP